MGEAGSGGQAQAWRPEAAAERPSEDSRDGYGEGWAAILSALEEHDGADGRGLRKGVT